MANETIINDSPVPVDIAEGGYSLLAPGLVGKVTEMTHEESATRGESGFYEQKLVNALKVAEISSLIVFEIEATSDATAALTGSTRAGSLLVNSSGEPAMVLTIPKVGANVQEAVLYTDEAGVSRWVFPETSKTTATITTRGNSGEVEFLLPLNSAPIQSEPDEHGVTRGRLTKIGRRLVRVLAWATDGIIGSAAIAAATAWENAHRPYSFQAVPFDSAANDINWKSLSQGPTLLLIHGTFSTAESGFGLLPADTLAQLSSIYNGRMFAFNHPTMHHSPQDNIKQLLEMLPDGIDLTLDIVTHSRGGLVGRELTERLAGYNTGGRKIQIRRAVFVAAPHRGTILTDADHSITMLDRYTNLFTDLPDNAFTITMEALFMLVKLVYHGAFKALPGLRCMYPGGDYLQEMNASPNSETKYYAFGADYKPKGSSLLSRFGWKVADAAADGIFNEANDGVVPMRGDYEVDKTITGFPIENRVLFNQDDLVNHCNYFGNSVLHKQLVDWLR